LGELREIDVQLDELGYRIIAVSADSPAKLRESLDKHELTYTLLSDSTMAGARAFGLAFQETEEGTEALKKHGLDIEAASGMTHHILPVPAAFVLGTDGKIRYQYVNPDYTTRISADVLLAAAKAALERD